MKLQDKRVVSFNNRLATYSEYVKCMDLNGVEKTGTYKEWQGCYFERFVEVLGDEEPEAVFGRVVNFFRHFISVHGMTNTIEQYLEVETDIQWQRMLEESYAHNWLTDMNGLPVQELSKEWVMFIELIKDTLRSRKYEVNSYLV